MQQEKIKESWEDEFDKLCPSVEEWSQRNGDYTETPIPHIKAFISQALSAERKRIENIIFEKYPFSEKRNNIEDETVDDIINLLHSLDKE